MSDNQTQVANFRNVDSVTQGTVWDEKTARSFFYQFIVPVSGSATIEQKNIRRGLVKWIASSDRWNTNKQITFNQSAFDTINNKVLNELLDAKLDDLNGNNYWYNEGTGDTNIGFAIRSTTVTRRKVVDGVESNELEEVEVPFEYGMNLKNPKGLAYTDEAYSKQLRNEIIAGKTELESLKVAKDSADIKKPFETKINDLQRGIKVNEEMLEESKESAYDGTVTLREVINNSSKAQKFYSLIDFNPEDESQRVALNLLREVVHENVDEQKFKLLYGDSNNITYEKFLDDIEDKNRQYFNMLQVGNKLTLRLIEGIKSQTTDENKIIEVPYTMEDLLKDVKIGEFNLLDSDIYPIEFDEDNIIKNKDEFIKHLDSYKGTYDTTIQNTITNIANKWLKTNVEPLLKIKSEVTITNKTYEERDKDDLKDLPIKMSKDTIEEYLVNELVKLDNISWPGKTGSNTKGIDFTKSKFQLPIEFKDIALDFETSYARTVGGKARDIVSSEKPYLKESLVKGSVTMDYSTSIGNKYKSKLKGYSANENWKEIRDTLNRYILPKKQTIEQGIEKRIKKDLTRGIYGDLVAAIEYLSNLYDISQEDFDKPLISFEFDKSYWLKTNGEEKYTYKKFINKILNSAVGGQAEANLRRQVLKLRKDIAVIGDFIDENEEKLDRIADFEDSEEDEEAEELDDDAIDADDTLTEKEKRQKKIQANALRLQRKNREAGQRAEEEEGKITEEEELSPEESIERRLSEQSTLGETEEALSEEEEAQSEFWKTLVEWRDDREVIENSALSLGKIFRSIEEAQKYKGNHIKTPQFKTTLTSFMDMLGYDEKDDLIKLISNVEKDGVDQKDNKNNMRNIKNKITEKWDTDRQKTEWKSLSESDYIELINMINLRDIFATEMVKDDAFNNAKLGAVTATSKNLRVEIDYLSRKILVKGTIQWESKRESYIGYKIRGERSKEGDTQRLPKVPTDTGRQISGKRVGPAGRVQSEGLYGRNYDATRKEFLETIKMRTKALIAGVKG
tara:strand:- start:6499 stop:9555 length:3057 start_codon:yes stop_codon:yes gene_type:complete